MTNSVMPMAKAPTVRDSMEMGKGSLPSLFPAECCNESILFESTFLLYKLKCVLTQSTLWVLYKGHCILLFNVL